MPRQRHPWFRFYVEAIYDRKLRRLTPGQRWLWVVVLAAARQSANPGLLEDVGFDDLADMAAMPVRDVRRTMPLFEQAGMVQQVDDNGWSVLNWKDYQYESDSSLLRVAKHRYNAATVTPPDTETDTDTEKPLLPPNVYSRTDPPNDWEEGEFYE